MASTVAALPLPAAPASRRVEVPRWSTPLAAYTQSIIHQWSRTLTGLGITLIPLFLILDYFMMPPELLTRFTLYRVVTTLIVIAQYFVLRRTLPTRWSFLHGYFFSLVVGEMIALMTTDLDGFNSTYYAGLNLVLIAANLLLPWRPVHSGINSLMIIGLYVVNNLLVASDEPPSRVLLVNNMYFLLSTALISVAINWVKERLIRQEFFARTGLQTARDSLWGEMEVAKHIQVGLLPKLGRLDGYDIAAATRPAEEVGGDYHDVIATEAGETWVSIGDVSGHGVESGLIMMMAQTSIFTAVNRNPGLSPSAVLQTVNSVLTENISRLGADRYMTMLTCVVRGSTLVCAGKHQDILVFRRGMNIVETIPTVGTWLGVVADLEGIVENLTIALGEGDVVLFFTDGVTEALNQHGEMFGEDGLRRVLRASGTLTASAIVRSILSEVEAHMRLQQDDLTLLALKRDSGPAPHESHA